jgi:hypothetical protein
MNKRTLTSLFAEALYQIPDYQRGYAWEEKQWKDFIQDIDALVDGEVTGHYTGTVVVYAARDAKTKDYNRRRLKVVDVVDGQQRLTTSSLYLSVVLRTLIEAGEKEYERDVADFLYSGSVCKLTLNNDTGNFFYDLLKTGKPNNPPDSSHEKRLERAYKELTLHIAKQMKSRGAKGIEYLKEVYQAITQSLHFTYYEIEEECEIGMTFELMNSRGKDLSVLELLKNYLMYWVSRNETDTSERHDMTTLINKNWKNAYVNLGLCGGNEDQCLRTAWNLYCSYSPKNWTGYSGFKSDEYIPLRNFTKRSQAETKKFITQFADGLAEVSGLYAGIMRPTSANALSSNELLWLTKIHHTGNIANFLPLLVAARKHRRDNKIEEADYVSLLKSLECYAYRVFLNSGRRGDAGRSNFFQWGYILFRDPGKLSEIVSGIGGLTRYYAPEDFFLESNGKPSNWYGTRNRLKYTLFEYELHLLSTEGQNKQPLLDWEHLSDSTIEHILPQNPAQGSHWLQMWPQVDRASSQHDIGNLVLTQNNSSYNNFDFTRKKGQAGLSPSYSNSDVRQERRIAVYKDWTPQEFAQRRTEMVAWINTRWKTSGDVPVVSLVIDDEADKDEVDSIAEVVAA